MLCRMMMMVLIIDVDDNDDNCNDDEKFYVMIYASCINKQSYEQT